MRGQPDDHHSDDQAENAGTADQRAEIEEQKRTDAGDRKPRNRRKPQTEAQGARR
jgi:hypothetical protein